MGSTKIGAMIVGALLLIGAGGCSQSAVGAGEPDGVPATAATSSSFLAPQAQDMPGAPSPSAITDSPEPATIPTARASGSSSTTATRSITTSKAETRSAATKATTTKATTAAAPKTTAPVPTYKPPSTAGVLTLSCTWTGTRVTGLASWSGPTGIVIHMTAPGIESTSPSPVFGMRVNGDTGLHGACTASAGGQSKSAAA